MSGNLDRDSNFEETNSQLAKGLKSCRNVLTNYRALLSPNPDGDASLPAATFDNPAAAPTGQDLIES